jgi:hypothetical protein
MQNFIIIVDIDNNSNVRMKYTYIDLLHIINLGLTEWEHFGLFISKFIYKI